MDIVRMLSFGAGTQSSATLLMADRGDIPPVDFAVFADTQAEPKEVYLWLDKIRSAVKTPIIVATRGNIAQDVMDHFEGRLKRVGQPPLRSLDKNNKKGLLRRHCTSDYKIAVVDRAIRQRLGYMPRQRMRHMIEVVMGISFDEVYRVKTPKEAWKRFDYPLIDLKMTRQDCIKYVQDAGIGTPPRSACYFCPFKNDTEWKHLKEKQPEDWARAVDFDRRIRKSVTPGLTSQFFVHRSCRPLDLVEFVSDEIDDPMNSECEGMCGV